MTGLSMEKLQFIYTIMYIFIYVKIILIKTPGSFLFFRKTV